MNTEIAIVPRGDDKIAIISKPSPGRIDWAAVIDTYILKDIFVKMIRTGHPEICSLDIIQGLGGISRISVTANKKLKEYLIKAGVELF